MKSYVINAALIVGSYILGYFLGYYFGIPYGYFFSTSGTVVPGVAGQWIIGFPLAVIFLLVAAFSTIGLKRNSVWLIIGVLPVVLFELRFDIYHIYMPIAYALFGWIVGTVLHKLGASRGQ